MAAPTDLAAALKYGPRTQQVMRRSQYLADALKQIGASGGQNIQSGGELAAKLIATAILSKANDKAQDATLSAVKADRDERVQRLLAGLPGGQPAPAPTPPPIQAAPPVQPVEQRPLPPAQPAPASGPQFAPEDVDALTRMIATEAIGEGPEGMAAAAHVAMNRLKSGHGGAKSLREVVLAPHQFEGMSRANQVKPEDYERARQIAEGVITGQLPDPTGGAVNFLNPELQAQMGRQQPAWAPPGQGQRIGRHVFYGGQPDVQMASAPGPAPQVEVQQQFPEAQPFQVAATQLQPGMIPAAQPSAAASSPPPVGAPPAAPSPQASAAGGMPTTYQPTPQEVALVRRLLTSQDPTEQQYGEKLYYDLLEKSAQPVKFDTTNVNGLPMQVDPYTGQSRAVQLPQDARTRVVSAQEAGIPAPPGTMVSIDPLGNVREVSRPQAGQQVVSAPGQGYREAPVQGGANDPLSPANLITGEGRLRDDYEAQIKPYAIAREGYQKVVQAARTGTPAGDIALVFGYMKTLDPGSTVREGEQAQVQNSGTIPQTITNIYNKLITGEGTLTPQMRAQFADSARQQFEVYERTARALNERYGQISQSYGYDPSRVVRQFEPIEPFTVPQVDRSGQQPGWSRELPPAQLEAAMRFKGAKAQGGARENPVLLRSREQYEGLPSGAWYIDDDGSIRQKGGR